MTPHSSQAGERRKLPFLADRSPFHEFLRNVERMLLSPQAILLVSLSASSQASHRLSFWTQQWCCTFGGTGTLMWLSLSFHFSFVFIYLVSSLKYVYGWVGDCHDPGVEGQKTACGSQTHVIRLVAW